MKFKLSRFIEFLKENPSFFKVWLGHSQNAIGGRLTIIARTVLFYQITNSASAVAIFSIFFYVAYYFIESHCRVVFRFYFKEKILIFSQMINGFLVLGYIIAKDPCCFMF
ncbi:hypothetical protein O163_14275 [Caldanaerobacter subterraneus subsp. yonseiensis KB-1]|uniref:Uncharacterized protein n=1 Tax=Caldanaerobacter subterraneus subsp. yonseiensis KB-1 TaxID=1388761 RepID=U5CLR6_CALSX|nr:hypothetical protein [Caldanaerobacter subterraneus]ERM90744.1 hypothetical protein O163_14275 [Caldanaerobacter subterraneus subsp. yonseiensis KB-1]